MKPKMIWLPIKPLPLNYYMILIAKVNQHIDYYYFNVNYHYLYKGFLQVQNEQLSQKVLELQIEIEKLKSKTSEYNSETVSASKYMKELSAAEMKIDELENRYYYYHC